MELMRDGFRLLADALREVPPGEDPEARLVAVATAYWDFAFQNPALYQVMHELGGVTFGTPQTPAAALDAFDVLSSAVQAAMPGRAYLADLDGEVERLWATLHGYVSLTLAGRIKGGIKRAAGLVAPAVEQMIAGWRHSPSPVD